MEHELELSALATARRDAWLPALLAALRARRRRRQRRRAAVAGVALVVGAFAVWQASTPGAAAPSPALPPSPSAPIAGGWQVVGDDATVLARCEVRDQARASWWLGDDELRAELRAAARPDGCVRIGDRVLVRPSAVDAFPVADAP
jgi:hypothetical protein